MALGSICFVLALSELPVGMATAISTSYVLVVLFLSWFFLSGGVRDVWNTDKVSLGVGSDVTFYSKPSILDRIYGNNPVGWKLFLRIRPAKMDMSMHGMHGNMSAPEQTPTTKP